MEASVPKTILRNIVERNKDVSSEDIMNNQSKIVFQSTQIFKRLFTLYKFASRQKNCEL